MYLRIHWQLCFTTLLLLVLLAGCGDDSNALPPTEEQQIMNVVENYFVRDENVPEYEAEVEAVVDDWARVSLSIPGVESTDGPMIVYLQNQVDAAELAPTADLGVQAGANVERETQTGWVIITQPQVFFTDEELDAAMVPEKIRGAE